MRWTERQKEKIVSRLLITATLTIVAMGVLLAVAAIFHSRR
jgi:hypothetical protein